jgi:cytochrome c biogenesis protein CcmG, thiol:disulfide interchange protein DsbE
MAETGFSRSSEADQQLLPPERRRSAVWPWLLLIVALTAVLAFRAMTPAPPPDRGEHHPAVGTRITTFHLEPLTGDSRQVEVADLEGKVTLVNFWGPWCGVCAVEFPHLVELEEHFRSQAGFQFFSVSSNSNPLDETDLAKSTRQFLQHQRAEFPAYRDAQAQTMRGLAAVAKLDNFGMPTTVLIGRDGTIRGLWVGYVPGDETAVRRAIENALR